MYIEPQGAHTVSVNRPIRRFKQADLSVCVNPLYTCVYCNIGLNAHNVSASRFAESRYVAAGTMTPAARNFAATYSFRCVLLFISASSAYSNHGTERTTR